MLTVTAPSTTLVQATNTMASAKDMPGSYAHVKSASVRKRAGSAQTERQVDFSKLEQASEQAGRQASKAKQASNASNQPTKEPSKQMRFLPRSPMRNDGARHGEPKTRNRAWPASLRAIIRRGVHSQRNGKNKNQHQPENKATHVAVTCRNNVAAGARERTAVSWPKANPTYGA